MNEMQHPQSHSTHEPAAARQNPEDDPTFGAHGQLIVGTGPIYISHLPMFMLDPANHPHNFQVITEVTFSGPPDDPQEIYVRDRLHLFSKLYTLSPEPFRMLDLVEFNRGGRILKSFDGVIFRKHFERPGNTRLTPATVNVEHVVYFHEFDPQAAALPELSYLLFGAGDQLFLAHQITRPPDFDQVLAVRLAGHTFTDDELRDSVQIIIPGRRNDIGHRLRRSEQVTGRAQMAGPDASATIDLQLEIVDEFYFEERELGEAMPAEHGHHSHG